MLKSLARRDIIRRALMVEAHTLSVPTVSGTDNDRGEVNTTKRTYEVLYITDSSYTDEQVQAVIDKYSAIVTETGGDLIAAGRWDKRRLAYEVKGRREGIYILTYFSAEASTPAELDRVFRISDDVFRHIILQIEDKAIDTSRLDRPFVAEEPVAVIEPEATVEEASVPAPAAETATEAPAAEEATTEPEASVEAEPVAETEAAEQPEASAEVPVEDESKG